MRLLGHILGAVVSNALALYAASLVIPNFRLTPNAKEIFMVAVVLTALNFLVRPILKMLFGPFILITLGLGLLVINGIILYLLDILTLDLSIQGIPALVFGTVLVGAVNLVFHIFTR